MPANGADFLFRQWYGIAVEKVGKSQYGYSGFGRYHDGLSVSSFPIVIVINEVRQIHRGTQ